MYGGNGKDLIYGGLGDDTLSGGNGKDDLSGYDDTNDLLTGIIRVVIMTFFMVKTERMS